MCGIGGVVNCGDRETLARMTHILAHRGPDDSGLWDRKFPDGSYIGLGSRRLAILDLTAVGHMPMCNEDRTVWITYNGEIYNFANLRRELGNALLEPLGSDQDVLKLGSHVTRVHSGLPPRPSASSNGSAARGRTAASHTGAGSEHRPADLPIAARASG